MYKEFLIIFFKKMFLLHATYPWSVFIVHYKSFQFRRAGSKTCRNYLLQLLNVYFSRKGRKPHHLQVVYLPVVPCFFFFTIDLTILFGCKHSDFDTIDHLTI